VYQVRLLICAGGTGGGVYPAQAIYQALGNNVEQVLWIGSESGMERELVRKLGVPFRGIPAAGVHGVGLFRLPGNIVQLLKGVILSRQILKGFKPDVILFTGGYVAAPMAYAAQGIPSLLFVPDIEPGLALRYLSRKAKMIALSTDDSKAFFSKRSNLKVTGYPVREDLKTWKRYKAQKQLHLKDNKPTLLILGGSKGARSINRSVMSKMNQFLAYWQVVHITGKLDWKEIQGKAKNIPTKLRRDYHPYPYLHEQMGAALASADLVVSRAGASTLGEYPHFGLPAILIPYPYAWRYQKGNAEFLVKHKAALMIKNEELGEKLPRVIASLERSPNRLLGMQKAMKKLSKPQAAREIAGLMMNLSSSFKGDRA
jgi:undecaprenyldiphospho-muramoylpentapeptide beta-N-acetylglucosaminyltransferase